VAAQTNPSILGTGIVFCQFVAQVKSERSRKLYSAARQKTLPRMQDQQP
jgi:hypothetical protein